MQCPKCGTEVVELAGFCHHCGERLDRAGRDSPAGTESAPELPPSREEPQEPAATPAERFKQAAAARQGTADEPEEDIWQDRFSSKDMIGGWVLSALISVALLAVWIKWVPGSYWILMLVLMLSPWIYHLVVLKYRQWNRSFRLTSQRFFLETGIFRRKTDRIEVIDMDDITVDQKLLERLFGVGTIRIISSDKSHPELEMRGIENVKEVAEKIDEVRRAERRRRGLHIEQI